MSKFNRILLPLLTLVFTGCPLNFPPDNSDYEFDYTTIVTETPVNLEGINSRQDDYNMNLPYPAQTLDLYFSSNRYGSFDIIHKRMGISYHAKDDVLDVNYSNPDYDLYEQYILPVINSDSAELGPLTFWGPLEYCYFFYADNQVGDFNIRFAWYLKSDFGTYGSQNVVSGPEDLVAVNSDKDDLYPAITEDQGRMFFCSNRENERFDLYSIQLPGNQEMHAFFTGTEPGQPVLNTTLSSDGNDKCPFICNDLLVFTSDRAGGFGAFDIYYSLLVNGEWTTPVNFGPGINTEYDEYRPVTFSFEQFMHLMIFSSDRPGGKGGFDLYMVQADGVIGASR